MQNSLNMISTLVDNYDENKEIISEILKKLDPFIIQNFKFNDNDRNDIFKETPEERLAASEKKKNEAITHPEIVINENIEKVSEIFRKFVKKYNLGFLSDFYLENTFKCEISTMVTTSSYDENLTIEEQKENIINNFKILGFDYEESNSSYFLTLTPNNIEKIEKLIYERNGKGINLKTFGNKLRSIEFVIDPKDIHNFNVEKDEVKEKTMQNGLSKISIKKIKKDASELLHAAAMYESIPETCGYLVYSLFAEISKELNVQTEILKMINEKYRKTREINLQIAENEKEFNNVINPENFRNIYETLYQRCGKEIAENTGLCIHNFKIERYRTSLDLSMNSMCIDLFPDCNTLKDLESIFDIYEMNYEKMLLDTEKNKETISNILRSMNYEINEFIIATRGQRYIRKISAVKTFK